MEWELIAPRGERLIVSKLVQPSFGLPGRMVLNNVLLETTFDQRPGLERTATAHEVGRAVFHVEPGRLHQLSLALDLSEDFLRDPDSLTSRLARALERVGTQGDDWWREWQAHTFMRFSCVPDLRA